MIKIYKCIYKCGATQIELGEEGGPKTTYSSPPSYQCLKYGKRSDWSHHKYELDTMETLKTLFTNEEEFEKVREDVLEKYLRK